MNDDVDSERYERERADDQLGRAIDRIEDRIDAYHYVHLDLNSKIQSLQDELCALRAKYVTDVALLQKQVEMLLADHPAYRRI